MVVIPKGRPVDLPDVLADIVDNHRELFRTDRPRSAERSWPTSATRSGSS